MYNQIGKGVNRMDYILRDIDINLWAQVKQKATIERKSMREVLFEGLKLYLQPPPPASAPDKPKRKSKKSGGGAE
jgi:hypothetical protein